MTVIVGILTAILTGFLPLTQLSEIANVATICAFMLVAYSTIKFRKSHPDAQRSFRVPAMPFIPIVAILLFAALLYSVTLTTWLITIIWIVVGLLIYFLYSAKHSKIK